MEELEPISVLDVVMALQRQGAIGQYRNSRSACPCFLHKWTSETCSQDTNAHTCACLMTLQWLPGADLADNYVLCRAAHNTFWQLLYEQSSDETDTGLCALWVKTICKG